MVKVAIVGAGVIGLSCATVIQERFPDVSLTIFAEKFSPATTSDGAAGLFAPYLLGDTPVEEVKEYSTATWKYLESLWTSPSGEKLGISLLPCVRGSNQVLDVSDVQDVVYGCHVFSEGELAAFNRPKWRFGHRFITYIAEAAKLLPFYLENFKSNGGIVVARKLESLNDIAPNFDVVINCSGLGAHQLGNDALVHPIRGHILRVKAPWVRMAIFDHEDEHCNYIIPNQDSVVLGGTHDKDQWDTTPSAQVNKHILNECISIDPSLKEAELIYEWVGLRPGRTQLRVEREDTIINGKKTTILHNYGHGGSGLTLFYGCALKTADLLSQFLAEALPSKL